MTGSCDNEINISKTKMQTIFKMKDRGLLSYYLGICVKQDSKGITLNQKTYLENVLKKFGMHTLKPVSTPMDTKFDYDSLKGAESGDCNIKTLCRQIIGCIMYAMLCTRPDLCSTITLLSRCQNCASNQLYICLKSDT